MTGRGMGRDRVEDGYGSLGTDCKGEGGEERQGACLGTHMTRRAARPPSI